MVQASNTALSSSVVIAAVYVVGAAVEDVGAAVEVERAAVEVVGAAVKWLGAAAHVVGAAVDVVGTAVDVVVNVDGDFTDVVCRVVVICNPEVVLARDGGAAVVGQLHC